VVLLLRRHCLHTPLTLCILVEPYRDFKEACYLLTHTDTAQINFPKRFTDWLNTTLLSNEPLATTLLADTILPRLFTAYTFPYVNPSWDQKLSFGFLDPENCTDRFFRNVGKKFHYLLCNNPEQLSSQVYWVRFAVLTDVTMKILRKEASGSSKRRYFVMFKMILIGKHGEILLWRPSYKCNGNISTDLK
jgi:hypothetical protein